LTFLFLGRGLFGGSLFRGYFFGRSFFGRSFFGRSFFGRNFLRGLCSWGLLGGSFFRRGFLSGSFLRGRFFRRRLLGGGLAGSRRCCLRSRFRSLLHGLLARRFRGGRRGHSFHGHDQYVALVFFVVLVVGADFGVQVCVLFFKVEIVEFVIIGAGETIAIKHYPSLLLGRNLTLE